MLKLSATESRATRTSTGNSAPVRIITRDGSWVVRSARPENRTGLASEYVASRIAALAGVPVPRIEVAEIDLPIALPDGRSLPAGIGTASEHVADAFAGGLNERPLASFWTEDRYLSIHAGIRVVDTWVMNYDRRKWGNVLLTGNPSAPGVFYIDFDQAFRSPAPPHAHWVDDNFDRATLENAELLSGVDLLERLERQQHFAPWVDRVAALRREELEQLLLELPIEWGLSERQRERWLDYLLRRREVAIAAARRKP